MTESTGAPPPAVRLSAARINRSRMVRAGAVLLLLDLVHVLAFWLQPPSPDVRVAVWAQGIQDAHLVMMGVLLALLGLLALCRGLERRGRSGVLVPLGAVTEGLSAAAVLGFAIAVVAIDQRVTPNVSPFLLACLGVGMLLLLAPWRSALLYGVAAASFWAMLGQAQPDATLRLSNQVNGLTACALGWLLSWMLWRRFVEHEGLVDALRHREAQLQAQQARLRALAVRDGLTQLWNRVELRRRAERELDRAQRHLQDTAVIFVDLDRFKHINDGWGHPAGDRVLVAAAGLLRRSLRASDEVGRLGGEEFLILLPQTDLESAALLAERLRSEFTQLHCPPVALPISASFGVASLPGWLKLPVAEGYERLYAAADAALYAAKQRGRNRVERAPELPLP